MMASAGKKHRILIIVENLPLPFDRRVWHEANSLVKAGYEVSVICPKAMNYTKSYELLNGIHIYRHPLPFEADSAAGYVLEYGTALFWEFLLCWRIFFARGFDVIQACNPPDTIFLIGGFFKLFGKKFVFDHHDINPELYEAKFGKRGFLYKLLCFLERQTFRTANISIATNESYRQIAITRGGMAEDKVFIVRSGPDLTRMELRPPQPVLKHGRQFLIGYVGVIGKQEGVDLLLEAAKYILHDRKFTDIHFTIIGGGTELAALRGYANDLGIKDHVTFTGRAPDDDLINILNTADICVNPDRVNDMNDKSTMNKIMEYMALGKPIVQFDLKEGRVSAQNSSLYAAANDPADMGDKILDLLADPERRAEMGRIGRERVLNTLSWEHEEPKLLAAYETLWPKKTP